MWGRSKSEKIFLNTKTWIVMHQWKHSHTLFVLNMRCVHGGGCWAKVNVNCNAIFNQNYFAYIVFIVIAIGKTRNLKFKLLFISWRSGCDVATCYFCMQIEGCGVCYQCAWTLNLFLSGFISSLPQLAWEKRLCCCCIISKSMTLTELREAMPIIWNSSYSQSLAFISLKQP